MSKGAASATSQIVRLLVPSGKATAAPPVGPALASRGVKTIDFVKQFNDRTGHLNPGIPTPVDVTIAGDRSFTFTVKSPPTAWLVKQAAGLEKGSGETGRPGGVAGQMHLKAAYEIARLKQQDDHLAHVSLRELTRGVVGTCRSMGIQVVA